MNISQAKLIDLVSFLEQEGYDSVKQRGCNYWYLSPIRSENTPSFKVDSQRNEWYDYGTGKGGDIIDLAKELYNVSTTSDALSVLAPKSAKFINAIYHRKDAPPQRQDTMQMQKIDYRSLVHPALLSYLMKRKIDIRICRIYCCEVHYILRNKPYFGIAFRNRIGGYEIRNPYFKGCIGHKDITIVKQDKDIQQSHVAVFEGFMDFLSYLMLVDYGSRRICLSDPCDFIIMNSISCIDKTMEELSTYSFIHSFLDNDDGGKRTLDVIVEKFGNKVFNETPRFSPYNDLNDYLVKQSNSEL
jgi:hypothetical protein